MPAIPYDRLAMPGTITPSDQRPHRAPGPRFPSPPPGADPLPPRIGESAPPGPPTGGSGLPTHIAQGPTSLIVYGPSLSVVNLTLYAFAHAANPKFLWVNIRARNEPIFAGDPAALGWVPREQLLTFDRPEAIRPNATVAAAAVSQLIAADEPTTSLNRLLEFVQLPDFTQCLLAEKPSDGRPGLLAVPNTHALTSTFTTTRVEAIIDAHVQAGYSLFVGYPERFDGHHQPAGPARNAFDYVFRVGGESFQSWAESRLVCEKGLADGPFRAGSEHTLLDLPFVADVFRRAHAERGSGMPRP